MSESDDSFGWVTIKKEVNDDTIQLHNVKKKKMDLSKNTSYLNDSSNDNFTDIDHKDTKGKISKKKIPNTNLNSDPKKISLHDSVSMVTSKERKKGSDEVNVVKKCRIIKNVDGNAKLELLKSDSDVSIGKKSKKKLENEINGDIFAKQQLLNSDSEIESSKKRNKKSKKYDRDRTDIDANIFETCVTEIESNISFAKKSKINQYHSNSEDQSKKIIKNVNDSSILDSILISNVYNNKSPSSKITKQRRQSDSSKIDLSSYLLGNKNLALEQIEMNANVNIEVDDDIWLLSCPHSLSLEHLKNLKVNPNGKTKLHFDNRTFECKVIPSHLSKNIIVHSNKPSICNILSKTIIGDVKICEKIAKCTVLKEEYEEPQEKIAFPDLKSRHPFFGVDYNKYINISPNVAEKLNKANKKKLKRKIKLENVPDEECAQERSKTPKKRKHDSDSIFHSKVKKLKQEFKNYHDEWESAESIERNLFHTPQVTSIHSTNIKEENNSE